MLSTTAAAGPRGERPSPPAPDDKTIVGGWEISSDGSDWKPDFDLAYARRHYPTLGAGGGAAYGLRAGVVDVG
jgi:hypothetical protein